MINNIIFFYFRIPNNVIHSATQNGIAMLIYSGHNSNAYILTESMADLILAQLIIENRGHLFHKLENTIGIYKIGTKPYSRLFYFFHFLVTRFACFTINPNFAYLSEMTNSFLARLNEGGLIQFFKHTTLHIMKINDLDKRIPTEYNEIYVSMADLNIAFIIFCFGVLLSSLVYFGEFFYHNIFEKNFK